MNDGVTKHNAWDMCQHLNHEIRDQIATYCACMTSITECPGYFASLSCVSPGPARFEFSRSYIIASRSGNVYSAEKAYLNGGVSRPTIPLSER